VFAGHLAGGLSRLPLSKLQSSVSLETDVWQLPGESRLEKEEKNDLEAVIS
jgi:hypothetical protein